jgi:hypothetical protein
MYERDEPLARDVELFKKKSRKVWGSENFKMTDEQQTEENPFLCSSANDKTIDQAGFCQTNWRLGVLNGLMVSVYCTHQL